MILRKTSPLQGHLTVLKVTACHTAGHCGEKSTMTETVRSSGRDGTAAEMAQNEQTTEEHSTLEQQSPERLDHPGGASCGQYDQRRRRSTLKTAT